MEFVSLKNLKQYIIKRHKEKGTTFKQASEDIGIGLNTLYLFLNTDYNIGLYNLQAICQYYGIGILFLINGEVDDD